MMRQNQIPDRLAGILRFCRVDYPARLQLAIRGIEDDQMIFHRDDEIVGRSTLDVLHVRRKLDQLEGPAVRENNIVAVGEPRQEEPPQDPLIRHIAGCGWLGRGPHCFGNGKRVGCDRRISCDFPIREFCHFDVVDAV